MENNDYMGPQDMGPGPEPEEDLTKLLENVRQDLEQGSEEKPEDPDYPEYSEEMLEDEQSVPQKPGMEPPQEEFRDQEYRDTFGDDLDRAFGDIPEEPEEPQDRQEPQPQRRKLPKKPKRGSGLLGIPHFVATILYFVIILAISVTLARMLWLCADDMLALTKEDKTVTVTISDTDTLDEIADKLVDAGLVRYKKVFLFYAKFSSARSKISSGTFELNSVYDYHALISNMSRYASGREEVQVMIPEGYTCKQIFTLLEENGVCTAESLERASMEGDFSEYWFLDGLTQTDKYCLEGYLFPDTYDFYKDDDAERVLEKMLDDFDYRFRDSMQDMISQLNDRLAKMMEANGYDADYSESHRLTIREIVIVASLIEKETASNSESPKISSVIYNRLTNAQAYPYLDIDATILYALGEHKEELTAEDLKIDSPYNTRNHQGLPPGPIANPGLASLQAALNPEDTTYHYYALDNETKTHHFSETYAEHEGFLASQSDGE